MPNHYHTFVEEHRTLRVELVKLLAGGSAHADFDRAVAQFPEKLHGIKPDGAPHSAWELLEHLRIAQRDMLDFSRNPAHKSPDWPRGYWPATSKPPSEEAWDHSVAQFRADLEAMKKLVENPKSDLFAPFPHGEGQTLLREALQLADHNAYHLGELIFLRRLLGAWKTS
ncbi:MAG: DinB family protein [Bryobacteraceae bacterium]